MSILGDKLGLPPNTNAKKLRSEAIRRFAIGGDKLLDALPLVHLLNECLKREELGGAEHSQAALDELIELRDLMYEVVKKHHGK